MTEKQRDALAIIPLDSAVLCQDCEAVSNGKKTCPACGSGAIHLIKRWLTRETDSDFANYPLVSERETQI